MIITQFKKSAAPWFHVLAARPGDTRDLLRPLERSTRPRVALRYLRGRKSAAALDFFNEAAAALQFPDYFGENWDAFHDCLDDLAWLPGEATVLVFLDAGRLLAASDEDARRLVSVLAEVADRRNQTHAKPFHAAFQVLPSERDAVIRHWEMLGLTLTRLEIPPSFERD